MPKRSHAGSVPPAADKPTLAEQGKRYNQVSTDFLKVDLQTALTFAGIALETNNATKKKRNQESARKAYDTVLRLLPNVELDEGDAQSVRTNLQRLKSELQLLGEVF